MISTAYYKIQELLLCAMIISLPLMRIPDRYTLFPWEIICQWYSCSFPFYYLLYIAYGTRKQRFHLKCIFQYLLFGLFFVPF